MKIGPKNRLLRASSTVAVIWCMAAGGALAQDQEAAAQGQESAGLEEIVVTARRVEEKMMEVPMALSAVTASDIQSMDLQTLTQLAQFTPGLFAGNFSNGRTDRQTEQLTFRGLSVSSGLVFIDGIPYSGNSNSAATPPDFTDVQRVEVLEGPQSAYFGRATYSGAVNYVLREPSTNEFGGHISADIYSYGGRDITGVIEGPITDKLAARLSGRYYSFDGQYENPIQGDRLGAESTDEVHLYAVLHPTDNFKVAAYGAYQLDDDGTPTEAVLIAGKIVQGPNNTATYSKTGGPLNCNLGGTGGPYFCGQLSSINAYEQQNPLLISVYDRIDAVTAYRLIDNGPVKQSQTGVVESYPQPFNPDWLEHVGLKRQIETAHLKMDYDFDSGWTIESLTSWDRTKFETIEDQNYEDASELANPFYAGSTAANPLLPYDAHPLEVSSITTDYYEELRAVSPSDFLVQGLHGTVGVSYLHIEDPKSGLTGFGISGTVQNSVIYSESSTPALFGGLYYEFFPDLTLSLEGRYQWDIISQQTLFPLVVPANGPATSTYTSFSPHVSLSYKYADDSIVYVLFSRGYEPGGYNTALTGATPYVQTQLTGAGAQAFYQQEKLNNYEVGIKSTFWDRRIQTSLALYRDVWENGQVTQTFFVDSPTPPFGLLGQFSVITNIGKVDLTGAELTARVAVTNHFTINGTADYSESSIVHYVNLGAVRVDNSTNVNGKTLAQDPKWTLSLSPQYTDNLIGDWDYHVRVDGTYRDRYYIDDTNVAWGAPLLLFDAHIGVSKDKFTIDGYVKNMFNNNTIPEAIAGSGESNVIQNNVSQNAIRIGVPDKRTFGIKATYAF